MITIQKGDDLLLFNGKRVIAAGTIFKMNSVDPNYYAVPIITDVYEGYVDVRGVVEVWRGGERLAEQLALFGEDAK